MAVSRIVIYEPDLVGIAEIGTSPEWRAWCEETALAIESVARAEAGSVGGTGQYSSSWKAGAELYDLPRGDGLPVLPYFAAVASNMDWHSVFVEYGAKPSKKLPNPTPAQRGGHLKQMNAKHVLLNAFERVVGALMAG